MTAAKSTAKKPAAKKPVARKPRVKRVVKPMTKECRNLAAAIVGFATEHALMAEDLGVKRSATKELTGNRTGMLARVVLDDGSTVTVTVAVRQK